jgi:hypothetical protein
VKPLTPYLRQAYIDSAVAWKRDVVLNTQPIDRSRAEAAIMAARKLLKVGMGRPTFKWFDSPVDCMAFIATSTGETLTRKEYLTDKLTPCFKWTESETTLNGYIRRLLQEITSTTVDVLVRERDRGEEYVYESTHLKQKNDKKDLTRQPDEIFKPETGQFLSEIHRYLFAKERLNLGINQETAARIEVVAEIARSCFMWWNHLDVVIMSARPTQIALDDNQRLHSIAGPALCYGDKLRKYIVHGIEVESEIIKDPVNCLTPARIEKEHNAEVRRTLLELYGSDRYLRKTGAVVIHEGHKGRRLWWRPPYLRNPLHQNPWDARDLLLAQADTIFSISDEPLVMVEVINSTPEPDGSIKRYFLRVPAYVRNADEAVAWTFGMTLAEYEPYIET